jgi:transposase
MWEVATPLAMSEEQLVQLKAWVRAPSTPQKIVLRSRICLLAREGRSNRQIARELNTSRPTVVLWRERFAQAGVPGIEHEPPRKPSSRRLDAEQSRRIVETTLRSSPSDATHWSTRSLARHLGISHMSVARVWDANGLQPHRIKTFKLSGDKHFVEKLTDVVGLYLNPPDKALVFCVDEKSQIQALDRTQPGLPLKRGRCGTMTHDYVRHGTTTLFAALNVLEGTVIGECFSRHRHKEFLKFLRQVDRQTPPGLDLHLIVDNYATHKHPSVRGWIQKHPRFHLHFIPTSSSWLNLIERWFAEITRKRIRRGSFKSVADLIQAIELYIDQNNTNPKPFVWTSTKSLKKSRVVKTRQLQHLAAWGDFDDSMLSCGFRRQVRGAGE